MKVKVNSKMIKKRCINQKDFLKCTKSVKDPFTRETYKYSTMTICQAVGIENKTKSLLHGAWNLMGEERRYIKMK